jgi:hypothetical protein
MGRYYWGDIEGKFAFGVQSSYDPEEFGTKAIELHQWDCGCESEYGTPPEDCWHIEDSVEGTKSSEDSVEGTKSSEDSVEGTKSSEEPNTQCDSPFKLKFNFCSSQLEYIKEKLDEILTIIPENFFKYMKDPEYYSKETLSEKFNVSIPEISNYFIYYYRYELGKEIYDYLLENDTCTFYGEL